MDADGIKDEVKDGWLWSVGKGALDAPEKIAKWLDDSEYNVLIIWFKA